jgi:beta-N-acetylhexosaminidase
VAIDPGLRRLALRTLLPAFDGLTAPQWVLDLVAEGVAGYVIFGYNIVDADQLTALTGELRAVRPDLLLSIDEEGGDVTRLAHGTGSPYPGNAALGAVNDTGLTERIYRSIGQDLRATGFNVDLAPTLDVNTSDENPVIGTRSFGADPARVSAHAAAAVTGLQSVGVAACAKHFPGHGATNTDSHLGLPTVDAPMDLLRVRDLAPFAAAIDAGTRAVMTAHIRVPALTGDLPATLSRATLVDLLRGELGFTGVVVTDALDMRGVAAIAGGTAKAAPIALAAGADLLCIGGQVGQALTEECVTEIAGAIDRGVLPLARVEEAAARGAALASWAVSATRHDGVPVDAAGIGYPAARLAVRIEGSLAGLSLPPGEDLPLIVQVESEHNIAAGRVPWGLGPHVSTVEQLRVVPQETDPDFVRAVAGARPIVVVGRNLHRLAGAPALIEALAATHPVIAVEMGWPSTSWRPSGVRAFVTTYGASRANGRAAAEALGLATAAGG